MPYVGAESPADNSRMLIYFVFFFISGFCGILYELIWLRLAMAQFGVTTAQVSIFLSTFMAGLGTGSLGAGRLIRRYEDKITFPPLRLYAFTELLIACSALAVPAELGAGHYLLAHIASSTIFSSGQYYILSGVWVAVTLVPWCACMGATIPLGMFSIRCDSRLESQRSFSFLYVANVLGAALGGILPLLFIELRGFHFTLLIGAVLNCAIAVAALWITFARSGRTPSALAAQANSLSSNPDKNILLLLFMTGLASMGMEVVWIRMFTPFTGVMVYSFAAILVAYLAATFLGSAIYRDSRWTAGSTSRPLWASLIVLSIVPVLLCDPRIPLHPIARVLLGVGPFAAMAGYLTPGLVDRWSRGDPERAATAYAVNVLGCILGPLLSGFLLLPRVSESSTLLLYALPWIFFSAADFMKEKVGAPAKWHFGAPTAFTALAIIILVSSRASESAYPDRVVLHDNTATVLATGQGMQKQLLVNGFGMTTLTPITKVMAHLPLAFLTQPPRKALIICFGMGTTYRSFLSWDIATTAVDLVPSVPKLFWYYHADAPSVLRSPLSHIVVDDGRRYLERTSERYDVITIDPPPPVEAAGSSLLYSKQFYSEIKKHLQPHGILQQWLPKGDEVVRSSVAKAIQTSFDHVRAFRSVDGTGFHFLASDSAFPARSSQELAVRLPAAAARDFIEWGPASTAEGQFRILLKNETTLEKIIADAPGAPVLEDDRPTNEYFAWRAIKPTIEYWTSHRTN